VIETARLILRPWRAADRDDYAEMCRSPAVMRHLGGPNTPEEVDAALARNARCQAEHGHCFWALERREDGAFLGFCGLRIVDDPARPVHGDVEIGWRLREDAWGQGFAKEAARASVDWAWAHLAAPRVIAFTVPANSASWGLMERLGMTRRADLDFDHPAFAPGHPLSRHITYAVERP
jgi:RimJ/RimL family protein N-acetyltransferase